MRSPVQLGGPFGFCAFALLSSLPLGSLEIALKRTRPRQRIYVIGRYSMTEAGMCQEAETRSFDHFLNLCIHNILNYFPIPVIPEEGALQKNKHP